MTSIAGWFESRPLERAPGVPNSRSLQDSVRNCPERNVLLGKARRKAVIPPAVRGEVDTLADLQLQAIRSLRGRKDEMEFVFSNILLDRTVDSRGIDFGYLPLGGQSCRHQEKREHHRHR